MRALWVGMLLCGMVWGFAAEPSGNSGKREISNFSLLDYRGKYHELRRTDARVVNYLARTVVESKGAQPATTGK